MGASLILSIFWIYSLLFVQNSQCDPIVETNATSAVEGVPKFWYSGISWPICTATPEDCEQFGFDYVKSDSFGDGMIPCVTGQQVLCQEKVKSVNVQHAPDDQLWMMSYNVLDFPYVLLTMGQRERTCRIPRELYLQQPKLDVIVVQELFMEGCMENMDFRTLMSYFGWKYSTDTLASGSLVSGGVAVFSKYPLKDVSFEVFAITGFKIDALSPKGFVYANFEKAGHKYHIVSTHFQAWDGQKLDSVRFGQSRQISNFLDNAKIPSDEVVIMGGDLNFDLLRQSEDVARLFSNLNMQMVPRFGELSATYDPDRNNIADVFEASAWLDYIAWRKNNKQPIKAGMKAIQFQVEKPFAVCMKPSYVPFWIGPTSYLCEHTQYVKDLSDHFPIVARLYFDFDGMATNNVTTSRPSSTTGAPSAH